MPITINVQHIKLLPIFGMDLITRNGEHHSVPAATPENIELICVKLNELIEAFNTMFDASLDQQCRT